MAWRHPVTIRRASRRRSTFGFCLLIACLAVFGRLIAFDYRFFIGQTIPNHDMYQAASFYTTSMHSIALTGDIAWWNPIASNGYAQYYQAFLSPLAPTTHSIAFVASAQVNQLLRLVGVRVPEYQQYLAVTYIALPLLAFLAVALLASLVFRRRFVVLLIVLVYCYSSIGLWNSAWFYFQEPASLFFLLAAAIGVVRRPSQPRALLFLLAVLNAVTSVNYWTLYHSPFIVIFLGTFLAVYWRPIRRLAARVRSHRARMRAGPGRRWSARSAVMTALYAGAIVLWTAITASVVAEQAGAYLRGVPGGAYNAGDAYAAVQPIRYFTVELFNPELELAVQHYPRPNAMHNARYLGATFVPLLAIFPLFRWGRRERWLVSAAVATLIVCTAPPLLLAGWSVVPFMDRIRHLFGFYTQHWTFMLALIGASSLERLLRAADRAAAARMLRAVVAVAAIAAVLLGVSFVFAARFDPGDLNLQAGIRAAVMILVPCAVLIQRLLFDTRGARRLVGAAVVALLAADLTKYFFQVNLRDRDFTVKDRYIGLPYPMPYPIPDDIRRRLRQRWHDPDLQSGFASNIYGNMPLPNVFWPDNVYLLHRSAVDLEDPYLNAIKERALHGPPVEFYPREAVREGPPAGAALHALEERVLWLTDSAPAPAPVRAYFESVPPRLPLRSGGVVPDVRWREWSYNDFELDVTAGADGYLVVRQIADPHWRISVDGRPVSPVRADFAAMAFPIASGRHTIRMDYRPLARRLFWPAGLVLTGTFIAMLGGAFVARRREA